ncbi:MAG: hypothetical protein KIG96_04540 [Treponema sp.]|nr:hypothetical protein [Treponema sp.]
MKHREQDYYECAIVLYNDDEKPGYLAANLSGSEEVVFKKAKKLWKDFIPYPLISSTPKEDKYPVTLSPNYVTTFFDWFYAPDLKRWFISGQHIPYPKSKIEKSKDFKINAKVKVGKNTLKDLTEQFEEWLEEDRTIMFTTETEIEFVSDNANYKRSMFFSLEILSRMQQFVGTTIQEDFAVLIPDEDDLFKILAWKKNEDLIRIQIHDYNNDKKVEVVFDAEIPLVNFLVAFEMYFNKVTVKHCELLEEVRNSNKLEDK